MILSSFTGNITPRVKETEDPEELERINVESEYNQARRSFLTEFKKYSELL